MKLIRFGLLIFLLGCENPLTSAVLESSFFSSNKAGKMIIISCIRCSCIIDDLNALAMKKDEQIGQYKIYGDTTCLDKFLLKDKVTHLSQSALDSMSIDFYNMLIYNEEKFGRQIKMIKTEDSPNIKKYL